MSFLPKFIITENESNCTDILRVPWTSICRNANPHFRTKPINPYRDFQFGGTMINWWGKNKWISDKRILGKLLRWWYSSNT